MRIPRLSRIGARLFAFNLLVLFVPVAGIVYLDVYETHLLQTQERGMVQQARLVAAALASGEAFTGDRVDAILAALGDQGDSRVRIFDGQGRVLGDSARFASRVQPRAAEAYSQLADPRRHLLYRLGATLASLRQKAAGALRRTLSRSETTAAADPGGVPTEVRAALEGRYGASIRQTPGQRSLTLNSAVPIRRGSSVVGVVVVSQSTYRILQALYDVRLRLFEVVLLSLAAAALLTAIASSTIVKPIVRLRAMARGLASRRSELAGVFGRVERRDEIGDLARSLEELAARLDGHIKLLESFAADVSHEFRNPLAGIRTAAETIATTDVPEERDRFRRMLLRDVDRLEGLVAGVRELARIDSEVSSERRTSVEIGSVLKNVVEARRHVLAAALELRNGIGPVRVSGSPGPLAQVFENLIDNAASFSHGAEPVEIRTFRSNGQCHVVVGDRGPGIPEAHLDRVFDRFFSYRPDASRREHMGLGLAIAKAIVQGYGGSITARNRDGGGAEFEVILPIEQGV